MQRKQLPHHEPALQEVHEWREKVFGEVKDLSTTKRAKALNQKANKILKQFREKKRAKAS